MEQSFSDLLSDAFSEPFVPSFTEEDLDFEKLNYDEKFEEETAGNSDENLTTKEDRALHQEATGESTVLSTMETKDVNTAERSDEEQFYDGGVAVGLMNMERALEEDYTSSDGDSAQEGSVSGEEEEEEEEEEDIGAREKLGNLLMSVCCGDEFSHDDKEDRIFAEGQLLSPEDTENPQVRNREQGESESNEEVSYFGRIPERGNEMMMIKGDGAEVDKYEEEVEKQEDSSGSECEGNDVEQGDNGFAQCFEQEVENPDRGEPVTVTLDFPEISVQNLQDLIAEVDSEEYVEKMKEFSGEEHQEAGESIADYPSDFSSCEYVEEGVKNQESDSQSNVLPHPLASTSNSQQNMCPEGEVAAWMGREKYSDDEGDGYLYSRDLEMYSDRFRSYDAASAENDRGKCENALSDAAVRVCDDGSYTDESESYSSSDDDDDDDDDDVQVRRRDEGLLDNMYLQDPKYAKKVEDSWLCSVSASVVSGWSFSDDTKNTEDQLDLGKSWDFDVSNTASTLSEDLLTTEDTDRAEAPLSEVSQHPAADSYFAVQREDKTTSRSYQGSVDDSFFFNTEVRTSEATELGQLGDDEYEDDRNWEQEQERIKAFYEFYDDSDGENDREERQIKVQFCSNPLSQVIHYETDSSDRDSLSSSVDREDDLSSAETSEDQREPDDTLETISACDPPETLPESVPQSVPQTLPESVLESDINNPQICTRKHKCLCILKKTLKMGLVVGAGLLVYWMVTGEPEWLSPPSFFWG